MDHHGHVLADTGPRFGVDAALALGYVASAGSSSMCGFDVRHAAGRPARQAWIESVSNPYRRHIPDTA
ncbi:hypothetical protein KDK95_09775 [Actinospica sp. MGRD01-02]|uniref:Uncharacterized protein n=1 Tax=Actinospica acidithermotolerans TaxID=2828514 RepID=A0A941E8P5_9ACTN|nr:hypothetical protein [Actinospica acidithermotolerans]MBR7826592.1 hypothetical protein [Actinospica acidithermotolerans]